MIQKHSSWVKLRSLTAWVLRHKDNLLAKMRHQEPAEADRNFAVRGLKLAERTLIRAVHNEEYTTRKFKSYKHIPRLREAAESTN